MRELNGLEVSEVSGGNLASVGAAVLVVIAAVDAVSDAVEGFKEGYNDAKEFFEDNPI